jgi:hypothetical protein
MRCLPTGTCAPLDTDAGDGDDGGHVDAGPADGGGTADATAADGGRIDGGITCAPNRDGVIERAEVPIAAGLRATFRVAADVTVDTAGAPIAGGRRRWDLSVALDGDHDVLVETRAPSGWYATDFPEADYVVRLNDTDELLGVFQITPSELALLGVVSPDSGVGATNVSHDPPVTTLRFPLEAGAAWTTDALVSGTSLGIPGSFWSEDYASEIDAEGELVTPFGTFEVLRVRVTLTRTVGLVVTTVRSFLFVSECFGTVATITSNDGERREEFTAAAEVRRLAP